MFDFSGLSSVIAKIGCGERYFPLCGCSDVLASCLGSTL